MLSRLSFTAARCMPSSSSSIRVVAYGSAGATRVAAPAALTCMGATRHFSLGGSSEKKPVRVAVTGAAGNIVCPLYVLALILSLLPWHWSLASPLHQQPNTRVSHLYFYVYIIVVSNINKQYYTKHSNIIPSRSTHHAARASHAHHTHYM